MWKNTSDLILALLNLFVAFRGIAFGLKMMKLRKHVKILRLQNVWMQYVYSGLAAKRLKQDLVPIFLIDLDKYKAYLRNQHLLSRA